MDNTNAATKKKIHFPPIGMRIIKSAIAVAVCFLVDELRGDSSIVFYSQLAALWCIQMYSSNTKKNAIQRSMGTMIGALFGLIYLLAYPFGEMLLGSSFVTDTVFVSLFVILIIYTTVVFDKKQASYLSCVVFLSIAVNHIDDVVPYIFVWNRFLDTMIGILIGIIINDFRICINPDKETLYISGLDDTLLLNRATLTDFSKVELNRMIDSGLRFTISTFRNPAALRDSLRDIRINFPVIAMDGAAIYDVNKNSFLKVAKLDENRSAKLMEIINEHEVCWFANVIVDDALLIYHSDTNDKANVELVSRLKTSPYNNFLKRPLPSGEKVVYFMLFDKSDKIKALCDYLNNSEYASGLRLEIYESVHFEGYMHLKIYDKLATKENMLNYLKKMYGIEKTVSIGLTPDKYDEVIKTDDPNEVVKRVHQLFMPFFYRRSK